jgi:acetylornithine/succinyldiaminopimelate/putrescine aminotransferase
LNLRQAFLQHVAQTSDAPLAIAASHAQGIYIHTIDGKQLIDLISGIAVSSLGHSHPKIVAAVQAQAANYMHLMVYGEYVEQPQVRLAERICSVLPKNLNSVYFTNSGTEATEGALKLAKRFTGRSELVYFQNSYHGSTSGALSVMGDENFKSKFRPLIPDCSMIQYGNFHDLNKITCRTAAVIAEPVQAELGVNVPPKGYLQALQKRCNEVGALFILDEIQTGMGRTGSLFRFEAEEITPDILLLAKAFGGGMPLGAFISSQEILKVFQDNPILGHITTFGGHPVSCAAALASLEILLTEDYICHVETKGALFEELLQHPKILKINRVGLLMAVQFESFVQNKRIIDQCIQNGLISDWFLFNSNAMRIAPPLIITLEEIKTSCQIILKSIHEVA